MKEFSISNGSQAIQQIPKFVQRSWPKMLEVLKANSIAVCAISGVLTVLGLFGISYKLSSPSQIPTQESTSKEKIAGTALDDTTSASDPKIASEKTAETKLSRWEQFKHSAHKFYQSASASTARLMKEHPVATKIAMAAAVVLGVGVAIGRGKNITRLQNITVDASNVAPLKNALASEASQGATWHNNAKSKLDSFENLLADRLAFPAQFQHRVGSLEWENFRVQFWPYPTEADKISRFTSRNHKLIHQYGRLPISPFDLDDIPEVSKTSPSMQWEAFDLLKAGAIVAAAASEEPEEIQTNATSLSRWERFKQNVTNASKPVVDWVRENPRRAKICAAATILLGMSVRVIQKQRQSYAKGQANYKEYIARKAEEKLAINLFNGFEKQ